MALYNASRPVVATPGFGARLVTLMNSAVATVITWNDARVTRNALSRLSDHQLDDLGLHRGEIDALSRR